MKQKEVVEAANKIIQWVQDACGDLAHNYQVGWLDEVWQAKVDKAIEQGVLDVSGWLADEYYDDPDTLQDLMGDRIYDESHGDDWAFVQICWEARKQAHQGMAKALDTMILNKIKNNNSDDSQLGFVLWRSLFNIKIRQVANESPEKFFQAPTKELNIAQAIIKEMEV